MEMQNTISRSCFMPVLQSYSLKKNGNFRPFCSCSGLWLHEALRVRGPEPVQPWTSHRAGFGCWLTLYSLFFTTRNQVELEWGKNSLWGETPPSAMCFPCMGALFQASATMADKFSFSRTPLGPGYQLHSSFLQTDRSFRDFIRIRKSRPVYGWHRARSLDPWTHPPRQFFQRSFTSYGFCYKDLKKSKHKSFHLNHGGGRNSKKYGFFFFFKPITHMTKFFAQGSNHSLCSGDHVGMGPWLWYI